MNPFAIAKTASSLVISIGAGAVVGNAIKASVPANAKLFQKISLAVGGMALSSMAGDLASAYVQTNVETTLNAMKQAKTAANETHQSDAS